MDALDQGLGSDLVTETSRYGVTQIPFVMNNGLKVGTLNS